MSQDDTATDAAHEQSGDLIAENVLTQERDAEEAESVQVGAEDNESGDDYIYIDHDGDDEHDADEQEHHSDDDDNEMNDETEFDIGVDDDDDDGNDEDDDDDDEPFLARSESVASAPPTDVHAAPPAPQRALSEPFNTDGRIYNTSAVAEALIPADAPEHNGITCDACGMTPIRGRRFRCQDCPLREGYDLCQQCFTSHNNPEQLGHLRTHVFTEITTPRHDHVAFALETFLRRSELDDGYTRIRLIAQDDGRHTRSLRPELAAFLAEAFDPSRAPPSGPPPAPDDVIDHLPTFQARIIHSPPPSPSISAVHISASPSLAFTDSDSTDTDASITVNADDKCVVCQSEFLDSEELTALPICHHSFHRTCVIEWLKLHNSCPQCRQPITEQEEREESIKS